MKNKRPSEVKYVPMKQLRLSKDYSPMDGLSQLIVSLVAVQNLLIQNPENYCKDYIRTADILAYLAGDMLDVSWDFSEEQCGGCKICEAEIKE